MQRRAFLKSGAILAGGVTLASCGGQPIAAQQRLDKIGLQLFTVDRSLREDFEGTLRAVSEMGYRQVEFSTLGGFHNRSAEEIADLLQALKLEAPNGRLRPKLPKDIASLPRDQIMKLFRERAGSNHLLDNIKAMLPEAEPLGYKTIILSAVDPSEMQDTESLKRMVRIFNEAGHLCAAHGLKFGYHNHDFDFADVNGTTPFDYLLAETNPDNVVFQLDAYWASKAGQNPAELPKKYPGRIITCHMKDMAADQSITDVGAGVIEWPGFTRSAWDNGARSFFVEHDQPADPMLSAKRSFEYLHKMAF